MTGQQSRRPGRHRGAGRRRPTEAFRRDQAKMTEQRSRRPGRHRGAGRRQLTEALRRDQAKMTGQQSRRPGRHRGAGRRQPTEAFRRHQAKLIQQVFQRPGKVRPGNAGSRGTGCWAGREARSDGPLLTGPLLEQTLKVTCTKMPVQGHHFPPRGAWPGVWCAGFILRRACFSQWPRPTVGSRACDEVERAWRPRRLVVTAESATGQAWAFRKTNGGCGPL